VRARIKGSKNIGTVLNKDDGGRKIELLVRGLRVHLTEDRLEYVGPAETKGPESTYRISAEYGPSLQEVNLIGLTVEDALEQVDKVIDQAVLSGKSRIELVHGIGTGALRRAIQDRLKDHELVKGFNHPDTRHGGVGVTTVELKG
jgi:DNA mismatch repair protein MutS2